jgi:FixJ family two-component response regulator
MRATRGAIVFVVDDDRGVRQSIQDLVESVGLRCLCFPTAQDFLNCKCADGPGCLILDVRLPGMSGLQFQSSLAEAGIRIPVIFVTGHGDIPMSVKAMKSGAIEFFTKPFRDQDLLDAIQQALERDRSGREQRCALDDLQQRYRTLTEREREVMGLVVSGMLNKQVASKLNATEATIKIHRSRVMEKMKARSLPELVRMADAIGVPPPRAAVELAASRVG